MLRSVPDTIGEEYNKHWLSLFSRIFHGFYILRSILIFIALSVKFKSEMIYSHISLQFLKIYIYSCNMVDLVP